MKFDRQAAFADLAEKEKLKGHHSPEGQSLRLVSRALSGWSAGVLSPRDAFLLAHQAIEDWLKKKLRVSAWSTLSMPELAARGIEQSLLDRREAAQLCEFHRVRTSADPGPADADAVLEFCIRLLDRHW